MVLPDYIVDQYWTMAENSTNATGNWRFPCHSLRSMPSLTIVFNALNDEPAPAEIPAFHLAISLDVDSKVHSFVH